MVNVVKGPSAVLPGQMRSSFACSIVGILLVFLFFVALVVWSATGFATIFVLIVIICCFIPHMQNSRRIYKRYQDVLHAQHEELDAEAHGANRSSVMEETEGIFQTFKTYRVTHPRICLCCIVFFLWVVIIILWPVIILFVTENYPVGGIFIVVSIVSTTRIFFDPAIFIVETGSFDISIKRMKG